MKKAAALFFLCCIIWSFAVPPAGAAAAAFDTVVIDAGHGGHDRGGVPGQFVPEKTVALDVALRLSKNLREDGIRTVLTRSNDTFIPLGTRVAIANARSRSIFVSIHFNSASNPDAHGIETYYYSSVSGSLAAAVHRRVLSVATMNRGLKRRGYFVLRNNRRPAILVECGFLTNRRDARLAVSASYRQDLADQIAKGILSARSGRY